MRNLAYPLAVYLLLLATVVGWGLWGYFSKSGISTVGVYANILIIYLAATVSIFIVGFFTMPHSSIGFTIELVYPIIGGVAMGIGCVTYFLLIQKYAVSIILPLTLLYVIVTVMLSVVFLHEHLKLTHLIGIPLMIVAAYLLSQ